MAKDIIVKTWCDRHLSMDEHVEGSELPPITIGGSTKTLDLCDPCIKEFVAPLATLLEDFGAVPEGRTARVATTTRRRSPSKDKGAPCMWCDQDFSAKGGSGYMRHIKVYHGFASAVEAFGTTCPICGEEDLQMMMAHINHHHPELGFGHTSQAVEWAKDHGDPYGVYAATLHRKPSLAPEMEIRAGTARSIPVNRVH
jgi:hypothetical protein